MLFSFRITVFVERADPILSRAKRRKMGGGKAIRRYMTPCPSIITSLLQPNQSSRRLPQIRCVRRGEERREGIIPYFEIHFALGSFYFGIPFRGILACDHGNRPSQVLDHYGETETEGGTR